MVLATRDKSRGWLTRAKARLRRPRQNSDYQIRPADCIAFFLSPTTNVRLDRAEPRLQRRRWRRTQLLDRRVVFGQPDVGQRVLGLVPRQAHQRQFHGRIFQVVG